MDIGNRRTVLIIEDNELNREILCGILEDHYRILQAADGLEGLTVLEEAKERISLILLDITMPVMNGYEFLEEVGRRTYLATIPIIVTTASNTEDDEIRCLEMGASDFVTKPYRPSVIHRRVESMIRLREASAMLNLVERDALTGVFSKEFFIQYAARTLDGRPDISFDMVCCDVENFKMINDRHGVHVGDEMLRYIGRCLLDNMPRPNICGRVGGDVFAALVTHKGLDVHTRLIRSLCARFESSPVPNASVKFGVYLDVDRAAAVSTMCDRAQLALEGIKKRYGEFIAVYDESIRQKLVREQRVLDGMERAIRERQFQVYYQPKHSLRTGALSGAEALVRWIHPEYGFLSPGEFIPIFERNGFITKLDFYVWETVCRDLGEWTERGLDPMPVSTNISRADIDVPDLDWEITCLADRCRVPHDRLHLEITESAYTEDPEQLTLVVDGLRERGFLVELDDFGSGYSSLNTLNELSFDVLKLDMSLVRQMASEKKKKVLSSVLDLAKQLGLYSVAEGVETQEQAQALREMGCDHAQGYYYAKPMPKAEFEDYLRAQRAGTRRAVAPVR